MLPLVQTAHQAALRHKGLAGTQVSLSVTSRRDFVFAGGERADTALLAAADHVVACSYYRYSN